MAEAFAASPETIGSLLGSLTRERVIVPAFQRGYMWKKKHVEQFWRDVVRFQTRRSIKGNPDKYFLGPIVTLRSADDNAIKVLDGQQRLATATILFSAMRDCARTLHASTLHAPANSFADQVQSMLIDKEGVGYSLELGDTDKSYFRETIQADPPTAKKQKSAHIATLQMHGHCWPRK